MTGISLFAEVPIILAAVAIVVAAWKGIKIIIVHRKENGKDNGSSG